MVDYGINDLDVARVRKQNQCEFIHNHYYVLCVPIYFLHGKYPTC